jgi:hypothetical protein
MSRRLAFLAAFAAMATFAPVETASAADMNVRIDGIGSRQCSSIVAGYKEQPTAVANDMMGWAYGYMTRRNYERARQGLSQIRLQTEKFGPAEMIALMLGFCGENPDVYYFVAVDALFEVLAKDQGIVS